MLVMLVSISSRMKMFHFFGFGRGAWGGGGRARGHQWKLDARTYTYRLWMLLDHTGYHGSEMGPVKCV